MLVMYLTGVRVCPAILEVIEPPRWDPDEVDDAWPGAGDRWGVVTPVRCIATIDNDDAPTLGQIGVAARSIQRKGHVGLAPWQFAEAERAIVGRGGGGTARRPKRRAAQRVPVEERFSEDYTVSTPAAVRRAVRRESGLMHDYLAHMSTSGDDICRYRIPVADGGDLYCDLFNASRGQMIEAKSVADRGSIRMAIGQLADYARFISPTPTAAVLLEAKPAPDLMALLRSQDIAAIWRVGDAFADSAGGRYT